MHQVDETPPPPEPAESFQTVSEPEPREVPPTPTTFGWLAGSSTDRTCWLGELASP
jgi:hypothetical protein